ncbi:uncharacterized protein LOC106467798 [Limulus polyphemus]|uniref:Uncharacterized protein LOC106467798 n=1 Tax=Limulus polyphemus TaxID=6850 RepID=A0ABM1BK76_LIMPO|nr:uncharacterized protein LOC106467798 [Limulus polyphemus]
MASRAVAIFWFLSTATLLAGETMILTVPLSDNTNLVLSPVATQFSCENKTYGYYVDVEAACKVYHICNPYIAEQGQEKVIQYVHYSFYCREETIFNQATLACEPPEQAIPCGQTPVYHSDANHNVNPEPESS